MNAIYNAAQSMKKHTFPRKTSSTAKLHDKPWFDTECDQHRTEAISALKTFRIIKIITALDHYKRVKNVYKNIIKSKKSKYLEKRSNMLSGCEFMTMSLSVCILYLYMFVAYVTKE